MTENHHIQSIISDYAAKFLKDHYGEIPKEIEVVYKEPFLLIHLKEFILTSEKILIRRGELKRVLENRDLLMDSVKHEFLGGIQAHLPLAGKALFYDWNLDHQSGFLLTVIDTEVCENNLCTPPSGANGARIKEIIEMNSTLAQKKPVQTQLYWLNSRTLLVQRTGILVDIEKQLIENGAANELRMAKRPLEYRVRTFFNLDSFLPSPLEELMVDWDFYKDISYMVLIMKGQ